MRNEDGRNGRGRIRRRTESVVDRATANAGHPQLVKMKGSLKFDLVARRQPPPWM